MRYSFFIRASKFLMKLNDFIFRRFSPQNIILFSFRMKHSYLLTFRLTPDVNNRGYFIKEWGYLIKWSFIGEIEYSNKALEEYKVTYPDEITLRHGCSPVYLLPIFRTAFLKKTSWWLLLEHTITSKFVLIKRFRW